MRLTLRTLLAYLDDLLEPSQAKELGAKIQESEMATELVMKIRDVIRKRRLTAPVVSGPGCDLDANLVAEYLDNTLSPEGVTDLERICLESDVHLAEVAASHQILTLVLGEPVDIGPLSRDRMYALGEAAKTTTPATAAVASSGTTGAIKPVTAAATTGLGPAVKPVAGSRISSATIPASGSTQETVVERKPAEPFDRTIPDYLKAPPLWKRSLPLGIALLILVWLGVLFRDQEMVKSLVGGKASPAVPVEVAEAGGKAAVADKPAIAKKAPVEPVANPAPEQLVAEDSTEAPEMTEPEPAGEQVAAANSPETPASVDAPPPADAVDIENPIKLTPGTTSPPGRAVAKADSNNSKTNAKPPVAPEPAPIVRSNPAQYVSPDGIVLHYDADRAGWYQLPHRSHVFADDALAVPEPFDAQIQLGREKHRLTVLGPAVVGVTDPNKDIPMGINLLRGRVILQPAEANEATPDAPIAPVKMQLSIQGASWRLELADTNTRCGVEVIPREPRQFEEDFGTHGWSGRLYVWTGSVKVTNAEGQDQTLTAPDSLVLAADPTAPNAEPVTSKDLPNWDRRLSTIAQKNARLFADEFKADEASAYDALLGLVNSRVYALSRLAVSCLGLIGNYEMMLEVMDRNEHHESRVAAIESLRSWVNQDPQNRVKLKEAIAAKFYPQEADVVYRLIWGYQEQDARSKQTSAQLVDWLEHDRLAVREMAWYYIKLLTNRRMEVFDARANLMHINAAAQKIRRILDKDGTLLPPLPGKPAVAE